jgi:hypothetical protein
MRVSRTVSPRPDHGVSEAKLQVLVIFRHGDAVFERATYAGEARAGRERA